MLEAIPSKKFDKDVALLKKRRKDMDKLKTVLTILQAEQTIPSGYRDHQLRGNLKEQRELHLEDDWLVLYKIDPPYLRLYRTGRHQDVFG